MQKSFKCPQCGKDVPYITNPCPGCGIKLDWRHQPPIPYVPARAGGGQLPNFQQPASSQPAAQAAAGMQQAAAYNNGPAQHRYSPAPHAAGQQPYGQPQGRGVPTGFINTSGQGPGSVMPGEISGKWNWGAFLLNWVWGIGNSTWIALLCFVPLVGAIMIFFLGSRGNKWAWQNRHWDSVEHFQATQRTWARWGLIITAASLAFYVVLPLLGVPVFPRPR